MDRDALIHLLRMNLTELRRQGIKSLILFGPVARNEIKANTTIDFLVELEPPHTFDHFRDVRIFLDSLLQRPVELVVENPKHPNIQPYVETDAITIC